MPVIPSRSTLIGLSRFLLAGLPAFIMAVPLNMLLVDRLAWPKPAAYALVLVAQVSINFWICVKFVFTRDARRNLAGQFVTFLGGIMAARALDWTTYSIMTWIGVHYVIAQLLNVVVFSILKYSFAKRTIEGSEGENPV